MTMQRALAVHPMTDRDHEVVERLADWSEDSPAEAAACARRMCEGDKEGWEIPSWKDSLRRILVNTLSSSSEVALQGRSLIGYLASRGFTDFRDITANQGQQSDEGVQPT